MQHIVYWGPRVQASGCPKPPSTTPNCEYRSFARRAAQACCAKVAETFHLFDNFCCLTCVELQQHRRQSMTGSEFHLSPILSKALGMRLTAEKILPRMYG